MVHLKPPGPGHVVALQLEDKMGAQSQSLTPGEVEEGLKSALCISKWEFTAMTVLGAYGKPRLKTGGKEGKEREAERQEEERMSG